MISLNGKTYRHTEQHDDLRGIVGTATGASALGTITIRDTGFPILCFQNVNDDVVYFQYQMPHSKKLGTAIDSVHIHYADLGICYTDAHVIKDRWGSLQEGTD